MKNKKEMRQWLNNFGLDHPLVIGGPCSAETEEQVLKIAHELKDTDVTVYRAGIWKPRTRPGMFEGVGAIGLGWLKKVKEETGLLTATEVANKDHVKLAVDNDVDILYDSKTTQCWLEPNILTYDRPTLQWCNQEINNSSLLLLGNGDVTVEGKTLKDNIKHLTIKPWIFWPRKPMLLEKILKDKHILSYEERIIESIFIGNYENNVQEHKKYK